jgi:hypothetical protein
MGDRAPAASESNKFERLEELGLLARLSSAGLAGKPVPHTPPQIAADNSYEVPSPGGTTTRKAFRTSSAELGSFGGPGGSK